MRAFLSILVELDSAKKRIEELVWDEFPKSIRLLLDKQYVFQGESGDRHRLTSSRGVTPTCARG